MTETANHRKVVARYLDGRLVKGYTFDFGPLQPRFHVFAAPSASGPSTQVLVRDLKAVFFVRDFDGDPTRQDGRQLPARDTPAGAHVEVRFRDGEVMVGMVDGPTTEVPGFFLVPADCGSNNLRAYVIAGATRAVYPLPAFSPSPRLSPAAQPRGTQTAGAPARPLLPGRLLSWLTR